MTTPAGGIEPDLKPKASFRAELLRLVRDYRTADYAEPAWEAILVALDNYAASTGRASTATASLEPPMDRAAFIANCMAHGWERESAAQAADWWESHPTERDSTAVQRPVGEAPCPSCGRVGPR